MGGKVDLVMEPGEHDDMPIWRDDLLPSDEKDGLTKRLE
jgi:hypothetical protein